MTTYDAYKNTDNALQIYIDAISREYKDTARRIESEIIGPGKSPQPHSNAANR